jgi:DNA mismatch repair protein MutS
MVEMTEAANILNNATSRSLVILDEIGRGTSTYDGVSLAWAITEYLHDAVGCRALFATHYHELAQLAGTLPRLRNYRAEVQELETEVVFLHKIVSGNADRSYGIHVARMAGVPEPVLTRAEEVLASLEKGHQLKAPAAVPTEPELPPPAPTKPAAKPKRNGKPEPQVVSPPEAEKPRRKAKAEPGPTLFGEGEPPPF